MLGSTLHAEKITLIYIYTLPDSLCLTYKEVDASLIESMIEMQKT